MTEQCKTEPTGGNKDVSKHATTSLRLQMAITVVTFLTIMLIVWNCIDLSADIRSVHRSTESLAAASSLALDKQETQNRIFGEALTEESRIRSHNEKILQSEIGDLRKSSAKVFADLIADQAKINEKHGKHLIDLNKEVKISADLLETVAAQAKEREKEIQKLKEELKKIQADPAVGKNLTAVLVLQGHYGEAVYSNFLYNRKAVPAPDKKLSSAVRDLHQALLGNFLKDEEPLREAYGDDNEVLNDAKTAKYWRLGFKRIDPRSFTDQVLKPNPNAKAAIVAAEFYENGVKVFWSRSPSETQLTAAGPRLEAIARALEIEVNKGAWHGPNTYSFTPNP